MLSNAYFLAKFRFDTAENDPAKNLQNFRKTLVGASVTPSTVALRVVVTAAVHPANLAQIQASIRASTSSPKLGNKL